VFADDILKLRSLLRNADDDDTVKWLEDAAAESAQLAE